MSTHPHRPRRIALAASAALVIPLVSIIGMSSSQAAKNDGCEGGGFSLVNLGTGQVVAQGAVDRAIPASDLGSTTFGVRGRYNTWDVRLTDFAVLNYAFTGAANAEDITGGVRTPIFASKVPDLRGIKLNSAVSVQLEGSDLLISRSGPGASIKISAKDCATGGVFQMEPERADGTSTRFTHTLANPGGALTPFYFDNPIFRQHVGEFLGSDCTSVTTGPPSKFCVQVSTRVNIANGFSPKFVARDSAQVATRVAQPQCNTTVPVTPSVADCGGVSIWDVASGGRMGFVSGEDAVEVANPPTTCTHKCQAQNQIKGRLVVLGFPFQVPAGSRLVPRVG